MEITKQQLLSAVNGNGAELGRIFNITRQAVNKWPDGVVDDTYLFKLIKGTKEQRSLYRKTLKHIRSTQS